MSASVLVATAALLATVLPGASGRKTYRHRVNEYGENATILCSEEFGNLTHETFVHWVDNNLNVLNSSFMGNNRLKMEGTSLNLSPVDENDMGDYLCYVVMGRPIYYKTTVYLYIPGTWEIYKWNFIYGLSFGAATLVVMTLLCVGFSCFFDKKSKHYDVEGHQPVNQYNGQPNQAMEMVEPGEAKQNQEDIRL